MYIFLNTYKSAPNSLLICRHRYFELAMVQRFYAIELCSFWRSKKLRGECKRWNGTLFWGEAVSPPRLCRHWLRVRPHASLNDWKTPTSAVIDTGFWESRTTTVTAKSDFHSGFLQGRQCTRSQTTTTIVLVQPPIELGRSCRNVTMERRIRERHIFLHKSSPRVWTSDLVNDCGPTRFIKSIYRKIVARRRTLY